MIDTARIQELKDEIGEDDFSEVLEVFLEEIESALDGLDPDGPPDRLAADLHALKGSAQNIGFAEVARLCLDAEAGGPKSDLKARLAASLAASKVAIQSEGGPSG